MSNSPSKRTGLQKLDKTERLKKTAAKDTGALKKSVKERMRDPPLLTELEDFVARELSTILQCEGNLTPRTTRTHSLPVYRAAFERFIDAFERYSPLLTDIKEHYEDAVRDYEHAIGRNSSMRHKLCQMQTEKDHDAGRLERQYRDENKGLLMALKHQTNLVRQYEGSVAILKEELVKVYRERDAERQARLKCETTLKILSKSVKNEQDSIKCLTAQVKNLTRENAQKKTELAQTQNKIDPTTYSNAMDSLAQAHSELEAKTKENRALNGRIRELEALQHKIDTNVCSVRPRMPAKADLKKYERAARGDGAEFEWVLVAQSKVREAPWHTDGAGRHQCRAHHRYIRGLGEISQTAYLRADNHTKLRNAHMSLSEVALVVQAVFKTMIEASEAKLVIDVFWDHIQQQHTLRSSGYVQHANSPAAIQFAYCFLTSVEQLSFEPQIELFRGMMTGELPPAALTTWKGMLGTLHEGLAGRGLTAAGRDSLPQWLGELSRQSLQKTDEEVQALVTAVHEDIAVGRIEVEDWLDDTFDLSRPPSVVVDLLWDQFYATEKEKVKRRVDAEPLPLVRTSSVPVTIVYQ